jgi:hypothetical protein
MSVNTVSDVDMWRTNAFTSVKICIVFEHPLLFS